MTWFGKILTFVVMVMAVVTMYFMAQAFATRTAWKERADDAAAKLRESEKSRAAEQRAHQTEVDALRQLAGVETKRRYDLEASNKTLAVGVDSFREDYGKSLRLYEQSDVKAVQQGANLTQTLGELETNRKQITILQNESAQKQIELEGARREATKANNAARLALALADDNARKVEELQQRVNELRAQGGGPRDALRDLSKPPPPLLANTRGEVTHVDGDLLVVSIGIDSGLAVNTVLEVSRGDGTYLGTAKVTDVGGLFPKQAIVVFTPARGNVPFDKLPAAALPRKGDLVRPNVR
jgi:predicted Holliday junction resolvase-like endonuclease